MKIIWKALIGTAVVHILYFAAVLSVGYMKTNAYRTNFSSAWESTENLQGSADFGSAISPIVYAESFLAVTAVCALLLVFYNRLVSTSNQTEKTDFIT